MNYVDNQKFWEALKERRRIRNKLKEGEEEPRITEYLGKCFLDIATNVSNKARFYGYSYKDDMISDAYYNCIRYIDTFDPERGGNPFAFFTRTCINSFFGRINLEDKQQYMKYKTFEEFLIGSDYYTTSSGDDIVKEGMYDNMKDFIGSYEKRQYEKKQRLLENSKIKKDKK